MSKHKPLPYEWDLYFDVKDTSQLRDEYRRLIKQKMVADDKLKLMREMAQEQGLTRYLIE